MASCLSAELDCTAFSTAGDQSISKSRYIKKAVFFIEKDYLIFEICANAFLWKMVRSIVGTLLHLDEIGASKKDFKDILESKMREKAGPTAPPQGLFLWSIEYPKDLLKTPPDSF